jgi:hypothetical protein
VELLIAEARDNTGLEVLEDCYFWQWSDVSGSLRRKINFPLPWRCMGECASYPDMR